MVVNDRTMNVLDCHEPFQPLESIVTTPEENRRQLRHLHPDHSFGHSINRSGRFVGARNGSCELEQINHLVDRMHLGRPRVVHRKVYPIQAEIVFPVFDSGSQESLKTMDHQ